MVSSYISLRRGKLIDSNPPWFSLEVRSKEFHLYLRLLVNGQWKEGTALTLVEGTDTSQGMGQLLSNISACQAVAQTVATTLGPRGMDKLIVDERGNATISSELFCTVGKYRS
jgi:hypothetical protein